MILRVWHWVWGTSVRRQLIAGVALVHMLLMTIFVYDLVNRQRQFLLERDRHRAQSQAQLLAANSVHGAISHDLAALAEILDVLQRDHYLLHASVTDARGRVLAHTDPAKIGLYRNDEPASAVLTGLPQAVFVQEDAFSVEAAAPIVVQKRVIGWAWISRDLTAVRSHLAYVTKAGLAYTAAAILIGTLFALLLARIVTRQLRLLLAGTERMAGNELEQPVPVTTENEVGVAARAFNGAMRKLSDQQRALRESEVLLRVVTESSPDPIFVKDRESRLLLANPATLQAMGKSAAEAIGRNDAQIYADPEAGRVILETDRRIMSSGLAEVLEEAIPTPEGIRLFLSTKAPWRDKDGTVIGLVGLARDITARKQAENERETAVEFLRLVNESRDKDQLIRSAATFFQAQAGCEAVGVRLREGDDYPYYEARGFPKEFVQAENSLCSRDDSGNVLRDGRGSPVLSCMCGNVICGRFDPAKSFFTPVGSFWTNSTTQLLTQTSEADRQARTRNRCNGEGYESVALIALRVGENRLGLLQLNDHRRNLFTPEVIARWERLGGYLAVALAKFRAEESLRKSEEHYRSLFENMLNGFAYCRMLFDRGRPGDFIYLSVNNAFETLTGLKNVAGKKVSEVIPGIQESDPELFEIYGRVASTGKPERFERYVKALRMWFWISVYSPKKEHFVAVFDVITERKQAEKALQDSLEEKVALLKEVHHRVKNNLQIVASLLNLQANRAKPSDVADLLQDTHNRIRSMALLHETLYRSGNLARINFAAYVSELCRQLLRSFGPIAGRVELENRVERIGLPLELSVPCGLIISELVSNALKHGFPGERTGRVTVELRRAEGVELMLRVSDNGQGLPPGLDPENTATLGLQLVSNLARQVKGKLSVETRDNGGAAFTLLFSAGEDGLTEVEP